MLTTLDKYRLQDLVAETRFSLSTQIPQLGSKEQNIVRDAASEYGFKINEKELAELFNAGKLIKDDKVEYSGAVVQIEGNYTIPAVQTVETEVGRVKIHLFIYHQTLVNKKNKELSRKLLEKSAVEVFPGTDEEWLYEALSEVSDKHFYETSKESAKGLPTYIIKFKDDGNFKIEEMESQH